MGQGAFKVKLPRGPERSSSCQGSAGSAQHCGGALSFLINSVFKKIHQIWGALRRAGSCGGLRLGHGVKQFGQEPYEVVQGPPPFPTTADHSSHRLSSGARIYGRAWLAGETAVTAVTG